MDVSIVIVNFNTSSMLKDCLASIYKNTKDINFEIIVSDNNSSDDSIEMIKTNFPDVILVENKENLGFGKANNFGQKIAKGKYIFYLNSDTLLVNNAVKIFFDYFEKNGLKESLGALGGYLKNQDGQSVHSYGKFPTYKLTLKDLLLMGITNFFLSVFYILHLPTKNLKKSKDALERINQTEETKEVDYITGADLFMLNNENAKFDENYFLYFEDSKLQYDLQKIGKVRKVIKGPEIIHLVGGSVNEGYTIKRKATFSRIQFEIARIQWSKDMGIKGLKLFTIRFLITWHWLNPFLISKTYKFIPKIWSK